MIQDTIVLWFDCVVLIGCIFQNRNTSVLCSIAVSSSKIGTQIFLFTTGITEGGEDDVLDLMAVIVQQEVVVVPKQIASFTNGP